MTYIRVLPPEGLEDYFIPESLYGQVVEVLEISPVTGSHRVAPDGVWVPVGRFEEVDR